MWDHDSVTSVARNLSAARGARCVISTISLIAGTHRYILNRAALEAASFSLSWRERPKRFVRYLQIAWAGRQVHVRCRRRTVSLPVSASIRFFSVSMTSSYTTRVRTGVNDILHTYLVPIRGIYKLRPVYTLYRKRQARGGGVFRCCFWTVPKAFTAVQQPPRGVQVYQLRPVYTL